VLLVALGVLLLPAEASAQSPGCVDANAGIYDFLNIGAPTSTARNMLSFDAGEIITLTLGSNTASASVTINGTVVVTFPPDLVGMFTVPATGPLPLGGNIAPAGGTQTSLTVRCTPVGAPPPPPPSGGLLSPSELALILENTIDLIEGADNSTSDVMDDAEKQAAPGQGDPVLALRRRVAELEDRISEARDELSSAIRERDAIDLRYEERQQGVEPSSREFDHLGAASQILAGVPQELRQAELNVEGAAERLRDLEAEQDRALRQLHEFQRDAEREAQPEPQFPGEAVPLASFGATPGASPPFELAAHANGGWLGGDADRDGYVASLTVTASRPFGDRSGASLFTRLRGAEVWSGALDMDLEQTELALGGAFSHRFARDYMATLLAYYGHGDNTVSIGGATGAFDTDTLGLSGRVTGVWYVWPFIVEPRATIDYRWVDRAGYTDSTGAAVPGGTLDLGTLSVGPTISRHFVQPEESRILSARTWAKVEGQWQFAGAGEDVLSTGVQLSTDRLRVRLAGGVDFVLREGTSIGLEAGYLGGFGEQYAVTAGGHLAFSSGRRVEAGLGFGALGWAEQGSLTDPSFTATPGSALPHGIAGGAHARGDMALSTGFRYSMPLR
jgi:hypothetical protein